MSLTNDRTLNIHHKPDPMKHEKSIHHREQNSRQPTNTIAFSEARRCYLTDTEIKVVKFVNEGFTSSEIATRIGNKPATVLTHRKNIKHKLNLKGYRSLEKWCRKYAVEIREFII